MIDNRQVGNCIAKLRQGRNMTQQQLAAALNVSHQAVSKWENGAALPDIQTLMALTKLFGVTVEQLMSGEIPQAQPERARSQEDRFQSFGSFVNGVMSDIGSLFRSESTEKAPEADDGSKEAVLEDETPQEAEQQSADIDLSSLLEMAPFMSKAAVQDMLANVRRRLEPEEIAKFAPFVESDFLETLIRQNCCEMNWDTLRRVAPFLRKEVVDAFARMAAEGERVFRPSEAGVNQAAENLQRNWNEAAQYVSKGMDSAVRKVVRFGDNVASKVSKALEDMATAPADENDRLNQLRRSAFERAMQQERWDWLEARIRDIADPELRQFVADKAFELGRAEWVYENLGDYADIGTIRSAIERGDWGWLGEHVWNFSKPLQQEVALAAAKAENWQWISSFAEQMELSECVDQIAESALRSGARLLAVQLAHYDMNAEQLEHIALTGVELNDLEFIDMISDILPQESLRL